MRITITSRMAEAANAALRPYGGEKYPETTWTGDVPTFSLEEIFRMFNRVHYGDAERLERIGYQLPSLSMGDVVETPDGRFEVAAVGFTKEER